MRGWPFFDLQINTPRLTLRVPNDNDLDELAELATQGIHDDTAIPFSEPWSIGDAETVRFRALQWHWKMRAELSPEKWNLNFGVWEGDVLVGTQGLFTADFPLKRTFETGSWLGRAHQGRGIGKEMRAAVLHLGFAGLDATHAATGAHEDNPRSIGVTESLGYQHNGDEIGKRARVVDGEQAGEEVVRLLRFTMPRSVWESRRRDDIKVTGLEPCLPLLGLATDTAN